MGNDHEDYKVIADLTDHIADASAHHVKYTDVEARAAIANIFGADGKADADIDLDGHDLKGGSVILPNGEYIGIGAALERLNFYTAGYASFMGCKVGIGLPSPSYDLDLFGQFRSYMEGTGNYPFFETYRNAMYGGGIEIRHARGTKASPIKINSADFTGIFDFKGYSGTGFISTSRITGRADGTISSLSMPGLLEFYTTPINSLTPAVRAVIKRDGKFGIGTETPGSLLDVSGGDLDISSHDAATLGLKLGGTLVIVTASEINYLNNVSYGINDSGGAGFKLLRVPN